MIPFVVPTIAAIVALVTWLTFVARYHFTTGGAWRRYDAGRNAMNSSFVIIGLLALPVVTRLFIEPGPEAFPGQRIVATLMYLAATASGVQRIVVQARAQASRDEA